MAIESVVIAYKGDISDIKRQVKLLQRANTLLAKQMGKDFAKGATVVKSELTKITTVAKGIKLPLGGVSNQVKQFTTVLKGANGQLVTVRQSVAGTGKNIKVFNQSVSKGAIVTRSLGQNLKTLVSRALLTIPVWFALRQGIGSVFRIIRSGLKDIVAFDRALQKLRRNVEATSSSVSIDMKNVQDVITKFSLKTGKSVESITNAIQKFATVGFDIETSLVGGINATKLAITLFGDVEGTALAFARSLRVMTEGMGSAEEKQKAIIDGLVLTDQLWQTNAFEVNEMSSNLLKFAGTARIANLSINETLALLATLSTGGAGNTAGRLLKTTIFQALTQIEEVSRAFNLNFDPKNQTTIEFITALIDNFQKLGKPENVPVELVEAIDKFFGLRPAKILSSLTVLNKTLKENLALTPDLNKFNQTFEGLLGTPQSLAEQFTNANKEIGKAFVNGIVGGEDFAKSLQKIVDILRESRDEAETFGFVIQNIGKGIKSTFDFLDKIGNLTPIFDIKQIVKLSKEILKTEKRIKSFAKEAEDFGDKLQKGLSGKLSAKALVRLTDEVKTRLKLDKDGDIVLEKTLAKLKEIAKTENEITEEKEKQTKLGSDDARNNANQKEISEIVLKNQLAILKSQGALNSELLKAEQIIRRHLNISKSDIDQIRDKITLQRELNEEKQLENSLSARTRKLAEIGRTEGIQTAVKIGEVLRGEVDFDLFEKIGGKNLEVFKKDFPDVFKEQQDRKFLQGKGFRIPIATQDQARVRGDTGRIRTQASLAQQRAEFRLQQLAKNTSTITENTIATQKLTTAVDKLLASASEKSPVTAFQLAKAENIDAVSRLNALVQKTQSIAERGRGVSDTIDLNIIIDGKLQKINDTPENLLQIVKIIAPHMLKSLTDSLINKLKNPSDPLTKATDERAYKR